VKISELINQLRNFKEKNGDVEIYGETWAEGYREFITELTLKHYKKVAYESIDGANLSDEETDETIKVVVI